MGLSSGPEEEKEDVTAGEYSFRRKVTTYRYKTHKPLALPERGEHPSHFLKPLAKTQAGFVFAGVCYSFIFFFFFFGFIRLGFSV